MGSLLEAFVLLSALSAYFYFVLRAPSAPAPSAPSVAKTKKVYEGPFTSFAGNQKCETVDASKPGGGNVNYGHDFSCDSLGVPSSWQKPHKESYTQYDLAIVGGGIGGAYLVSRLHEEFVIKRELPMPKIALFERSDGVGGRLMSAEGAGALNLGSGSLTKALREQPLPMPEYGGMRVDPERYPYVFNRIVYASRLIFGKNTCPKPGCRFEGIKRWKRNCCPEMLTRMEVGDIRYVNTDPNACELLRSSTVSMRTENIGGPNEGYHRPYDLKAIEEGLGTPFDKCMQLVIAADAYYNFTGDYEIANPVPLPKSMLWKDSIEQLCENCKDSGIPGMCKLCEAFGDGLVPAPISCTGYDFDPETVPIGNVVGLGLEVTDATRSWHLYLLNVGFQRFAAGLMNGPEYAESPDDENADPLLELFKNKGAGVAPHYGKQLTGVSATNVEADEVLAPEKLVQDQIAGTFTEHKHKHTHT